jgi:hypothetical protein
MGEDVFGFGRLRLEPALHCGEHPKASWLQVGSKTHTDIGMIDTTLTKK